MKIIMVCKYLSYLRQHLLTIQLILQDTYQMTARPENMTKSYVSEYEQKFSSKILVVVTIILTMVSLANIVPTGLAAQGSFVAGLTSIEEVPPVHSNATGSTSFIPTLEGKIMYIVNVTDIGNVTNADVHVGKQGENGPVVVTIFTSESPPARINGTLSQGNITSANLQGPMKGKQLAGLIDLFQHGEAYVNVATEQNPNGEIRGQIGFAAIDESGKGLGEKNLTLADEGLQFE
jgi:hypothetical protein